MLRSRAKLRGRGIRALSVTAVLVAALALPTLASAKGAPISLEIGPFKVAHGYSFDLEVSKCAGTTKDTEIDYAKGSKTDNVLYAYSGTGTCTATGNLKRGTLSLSWPGIATAKLKVTSAGRNRGGVTPRGCTGGKGVSREVVLKGNIDITASKYFGSLKRHKVKAYISRLSNLNCKGGSLPKSTQLTGLFGQNLFLSAARYKKRSEVSISDAFSPASGVSGEFFLDLTGTAKQFNINKTTATVTNLKPFASGKLVATKLGSCIGDTTKAVNATFSGAITVKSPVLGNLTYGSSNATSANIGPSGAAFPAQCNGYGSMPLTAGIDSSCNDATYPCSIADGVNNVTFTDTSTPGTQNVVSESINFGDNSTGTVSNGSATHTYASPGTYTATVTIQTSDGQTEMASTTVYIGS